MFYEEDTIKSALNCQKCYEKLDEARLLPSNICFSCTKSLKLDADQHFECLICPKKHEMLPEGLAMNKIVSLFLSFDPKEFYRGEATEKLKLSLKDIEQKIKQISFSLKNGVDQMQVYFMDLRSEVQVTTEEAILHLKEFNQELINQINIAERDCLASIQSNEKARQELSEKIAETELFHSKWTQNLKQTVIDDESVMNANEAANSLIIKSNNDLDTLEQINFNGFKIKFKKSKIKGP